MRRGSGPDGDEADGLRGSLASAATGKGHGTSSSGKGYAKPSELMRKLQCTADVDSFLDQLGIRAVAVLTARRPRQHSEYRKLRDDLQELLAAAPAESDIYPIAAELLAKLLQS